MKTLDEVIHALVICDSTIDDCAHCAYYHDDCEELRELRADAAAYLKEYRDKEQNKPLTWAELRKMIKKPVWIVTEGYSEWGIPIEFYKDLPGNNRVTFRTEQFSRRYASEEDYGKNWIAYRKETE